MWKCLTWLGFVSILVLLAQAKGFKRAIVDIPNPMTNPAACGRPNVAHSAVCDPDSYIKSDKLDEIEGYINAISLVEVAVVIIKQMDLYSANTVNIDTAAEYYARGLHDRYGVGDKATNNGILVFLSVEDRAVYISTGKGVKDKINHDAIQLIITNMKPELRDRNYDGALATCITNIDVILSGKDSPLYESAMKHKIRSSKVHNEEGSDTVAWILIGLFVSAVGFLFWKNFRDHQNLENYDRGRVKLDTLLKEMESSQDSRNKFEAKSCPICLEEFDTMSPNPPQANAVRKSLGTDLTSNIQHSTSNGSLCRSRSCTSSESEDSLPVVPGTNIVQSKTVTLRCGHVFCIPCMEAYLSSESSNRCPICRKSLSEDRDDNSSAGPHSSAADAQSRLRRTGNSFGSIDRSSVAQPRTVSSSQAMFSSFGRRTVHPHNHDWDQSGVVNSNGGGTYTVTETVSSTTVGTSTSGESHSAFGGGSSSNGANDHHNYDGAYSNHRFNYFSPEWRFRLHRMHYLYPSVVDYEFLRIANGAINRESMSDLRYHLTERSVEVQRLATDLRHRMEQAARENGRSGSSRSSFGGGRSSGGGGGRW
jgi:uncharacterized membrane protein YgcG